MCLNVMTEVEQQQVLKSLSDVFPCWKAIRTSDDCEFADPENQEPPLMKGDTYTAGSFRLKRIPVSYQPGYHAFVDRTDAVRYAKCTTLVVVKFWGKKSDIITVGTARVWTSPVCVVLKKITRK